MSRVKTVFFSSWVSSSKEHLGTLVLEWLWGIHSFHMLCKRKDNTNGISIVSGSNSFFKWWSKSKCSGKQTPTCSCKLACTSQIKMLTTRNIKSREITHKIAEYYQNHYLADHDMSQFPSQSAASHNKAAPPQNNIRQPRILKSAKGYIIIYIQKRNETAKRRTSSSLSSFPLYFQHRMEEVIFLLKTEAIIIY